MAKPSVQNADLHDEIVSQPDYIYSDPDPFERATSRLNGLGAVQVLVTCACESGSQPTGRVWDDLWYFVRTVADDVKRDMYEMKQSSHRKVM